MRHHRRLIASIGFGVAAGLATSPPTTAAGAAAPKPKARAAVEVADTATLAPDGQSVTVELTATCARRWQVLEAFVTVSQPQAFGMGGIPLTCTGRAETFDVTVRSTDQAFQPGDAQASAFVLVERRGRTEQAQDAEVIQVV